MGLVLQKVSATSVCRIIYFLNFSKVDQAGQKQYDVLPDVMP